MDPSDGKVVSRNRERRQIDPQRANGRMLDVIRGVVSGSRGRGGSAGQARSAPRQTKVEEIPNVDILIKQIGEVTTRPERTAAQIVRNISSSNLFDDMDEEDWLKLIDCMIALAIEEGEADFVVTISVPLIKYSMFHKIMNEKLMSLSSSFIMNMDEESDAIPAFLGSILCNRWPRAMSRAIDTSNPILFDAVSIVKGWILVVSDDNEAQIEGDDPIREEPEIVNRCAQATCMLCEKTQKALWMSWPEICDEIYAAFKLAITHNTVITGNVKESVLRTFMDLHTWTKSRSVVMKPASTQTYERSRLQHEDD
ncbi:unnamed protein product [Auanema sp. JU1783]|nr:unnamed protein product [Auanema sp. JU1783]